MPSDGQSRSAGEYFIATLLAIATVLVSLGGALGLNVGPDPWVGRLLGAAWAWAIGAATGMYWIPWVKQAVRPVEGGSSD